ncbi:MAG: HAD family hydrolase [Phycisphaerae bacterium]|jgi:D,D-heptose 1,7-bisphosphate phosphatase|nr:HAD family hydrolase [Phycisphaerae bacterium]
MSKAVFIDRDNTIIEDPGYISDPDSVKLLPGVELAIKSLAQAGFKNVVCTNQSGVARGMLTEDDLESIHAEVRRQLADKGAHLDAIYYCPFHPEGTIDQYACESDLRKPKPGMLLKAADEFDLELAQCWMVGDSARDIEAGQRAGCRTIRVRVAGEASTTGERGEDAAQADFTVRNLVEAARIIVRETDRTGTWEAVTPSAAVATAPPDSQERSPQPEVPLPEPVEGDDVPIDDSRVRMEILSHVRRLVRHSELEEFSFLKLAGGIVQMLALLTLLIAVLYFLGSEPGRVPVATFWATISVAMQAMALTFFTIQRNK